MLIAARALVFIIIIISMMGEGTTKRVFINKLCSTFYDLNDRPFVYGIVVPILWQLFDLLLQEVLLVDSEVKDAKSKVSKCYE